MITGAGVSYMLARPMIKPRQLILLATLNLAILPIGMDVHSAVLSDLAMAFDRDMAWAQYTLSTYLIGFAVAHLFVGPLGDRYGRKPVLLGGLLTFTVASAAAAAAQNLETIVLARLVQGFGGAAGPILARAIVRDVSTPRQVGRTLAWSIGWMGMVPLLGPWIAGVSAAALGWRAPLWIIAAHGLLTLLAMVILLPETLRPPRREPRSGAWLEAVRILAPDRVYRTWAACAAIGYSGIALWVANASAMLLGRYGKPTSDFGLYFGLAATGFIAGSFIGARFLRFVALRAVALAGGVCCAASGAVLVALRLSGHDGALTASLGAILFLLGWGFIQPPAQAGAVGGHPEIASRASAIYGIAQLSVAAAATALLGPIINGDPLRLGITYAGIGMLVTVLLLRAR